MSLVLVERLAQKFRQDGRFLAVLRWCGQRWALEAIGVLRDRVLDWGAAVWPNRALLLLLPAVNQPVAKSPGSSSRGFLQRTGAERLSCTVPQGKVTPFLLAIQRWRAVS